MAKRLNFKKIVAGAALVTCLSPSQVAYASGSPKKERAKVSFILGAGKGLGNNKSSEIELGVKHNRFALVGKIPISSYSNINLKNIKEEMSGDIYFQGREDLEDFSSSIGASLEYHLSLARGISWVTGIGGKRRSYTRKVEENLVRRVGGEETLLSSNEKFFPEKESVLKFYTGPSFKVAKGLELNANLGYEIGSKKNELKRGSMCVSVRAIYLFPGKGGNR